MGLTSGWGNTVSSTNGDAKNDDNKSSGLISNDFQVEVKLADQQADPNSPLYSAKTFEELPM